MVQRRSHLTRWHVLKSYCVVTLGFAMSVQAALLAARGVRDGAVQSLGKKHYPTLVRLDIDPGWYAFNVLALSVLAVLFGYGTVLQWRKLRREQTDRFVNGD